MSTLLWVPVPGGPLQGGRPVLRVVVTPRLDAGLLASGMAGWPAAVNVATGVEVRTRPAGGEPDPGLVGATVRAQARADVWDGFFHSIDVRPFTAPAGYVITEVRPTSQDAVDVRTTYAKAATAIGEAGAVREGLQQWHRPDVVPAARSRDEPPCDPPDFHRAVALLREHPAVLQMLGLVIEIELTGVPNGRREISVTWPGSPVPVEPRWTAYEFDGAQFLPASAGDIVSGMVDLSDADRWRVITFDVDGGVGRLQQTARTVLGGDPAPAGAEPPRTELPTLRSAGLMLTRIGRDEQLQERTGRGRAAPDPNRALTAEDLVLGYRLDVRPQKSNTWFSLHRRDATYRVGDLPTVAVPDEEGHLKPHAIVKDADGVHTDEVVARWDGWSLSAARPSLDGVPKVGPLRKPRCPMPYDFETTFTVHPGSLPVLQFGRAYQLRARVVDLAGGGLTRDDPAANQLTTGTETYVRYEPVPPPQVPVPAGLLVADPANPQRFVVDPAVLGPGGSLERLVIRSAPVPNGFSTAEFDGDPAYPANGDRTLVPPGTTFAIAEQHGVLREANAEGFMRASRVLGDGRRGTGPQLPLDPASVLPDPAALGVAAAILPEPGTLDDEVNDNRPWAGTWPELAPKHIELVAAPDGTPPRLRWVAQTDGSPGVDSPRVRVELAPGDSVVVEVSSTIRADDIDSFAINLMVGDPDPDAGPTAVQNIVVAGRHPMLTPPRRLQLVHAVRRPRRVPGGTATAERPVGATFARILPTVDPLWNVHRPSTVQLDVLASWDEWADAPAPKPTSTPLSPLPVTRGAPALPELRHEFRDTKHRVVDYRLRAVSRYRDCFAPTDADDAFTVDGTVTQVSVLSSARPAPPVVAATVPAFAWSQSAAPGTLTRLRGGGRLRVELGRPWFTTGEGEAVGVVLWPGTEADVPPALRGLVSWLNRDPIHPTAAPAALAAQSMFAGFGEPVDVRLPDLPAPVRVLPYPVFSQEGHWYADVAVPGAAAASYSPFAHLGLVRFQRASMITDELDLRASMVVRTDMVPVLPDRRLDVRASGGGLEVTLSGLSRQGPSPNQVIASIERSDAAAPPAELTSLSPVPPGFPVWTKVAGAAVTGETNQAMSLPLPADPGRLRLVVREVERLMVTTSAIGVGAPTELTERTVYVDVVDLPLP